MIAPIDRIYTAPTLPSDTPTPVKVGSPDYYQQRVDDFKARNPGMEPPDYYLGYGEKYMERFQALDSSDLSSQGLEWRDRTTDALQQSIEDFRARDPQGFAEMERDSVKFREFAFGSHPAAYVDSGLYDLPVQDLLVIAATPDVKDVLSMEGIDQSLITVGKLELSDVPEMAWDTAVQYFKDTGPFGLTPLGPTIEGLVVGEKLIDRVLKQDDVPFVPFI
ncbi:hypothetical protein [Lysobacter sp. CA199]|uniref:hypothetical protein n=1 Tax=Lysobacter sp. CA199 TaxID=3455608 RepID=UPI003F8D8B1A